MLLKRKLIALELQHIARIVSSRASTVQLAKLKVIIRLLTYTIGPIDFLGRNFHVTQRKSVLYYNKAFPIKCFVSHRPPSREGGSVGRAKKIIKINT